MLALVVTFAALAPCGESQSLAREPVVLQHVTTGEAEPELHAVVSIRIDGELVSAGEVLLAAGVEAGKEPMAGLSKWLEAKAQEADSDDERPRLLIRAETNAPFSRLELLLRAAEGWESFLAVGDAAKPDIDRDTGGAGPTTEPRKCLPLAPRAEDEKLVHAVELRVVEPGNRLMPTRLENKAWEGEGRYRWDMLTRKVTFALGQTELAGYREFVARLQGMRGQLARGGSSLAAGPGVTAGELALAMDALRSAGVPSIALAPLASDEEESD